MGSVGVLECWSNGVLTPDSGTPLHHSITPLLLLLLLPSPTRAQSVLDNLDLTNAASRTAHRVRMEKADVHWQQELIGTKTVPVGGGRLQPGGAVHARLRASGGPAL